jgi:glycosyltransferase involved in cell wall biosynthesis
MTARLLYVVGQLRAGGLERQLCYLLEAMDRRRYKPAVVVWNYQEIDAYVESIRSLEVPLYGLTDNLSKAVKLKQLRALVKQLKPEVIHSYSFYTNILTWLAALGTEAIPVGSVRSSFEGHKVSAGFWLGRMSAKRPRCQIFNNFAAARTARNCKSIFAPKQICVVHNGVDLRNFRNCEVPRVGSPCIVGVGTLEPVKRWDRLLSAACVLKKKGFDFTVRIVGEGSLRSALERQTATLGLIDRVEFVGHVQDVGVTLSSATFVVHTADTEGCPNVVLEAMACSRAVVATDAGDTALVIDDGKTGFVVKRGDDETLVQRLMNLIVDPALCTRMGAAGRLKVEREFTIAQLVANTFAAYHAAGWKNVLGLDSPVTVTADCRS